MLSHGGGHHGGGGRGWGGGGFWGGPWGGYGGYETLLVPYPMPYPIATTDEMALMPVAPMTFEDQQAGEGMSGLSDGPNWQSLVTMGAIAVGLFLLFGHPKKKS